MGKKWVPLESNPDVLNDYAAKLGADLSRFQFCDVYGLDEVGLVAAAREGIWAWRVATSRRRMRRWLPANAGPSPALMPGSLPPPQELLAMVPRPVAAVLLLFPITPDTEAARKQGGRGRCRRCSACMPSTAAAAPPPLPRPSCRRSSRRAAPCSPAPPPTQRSWRRRGRRSAPRCIT